MSSSAFFHLMHPEDYRRCYTLLKELRPHLSFAEFEAIYEEARRVNGYQITGIEENGELVALMGYRVLSDFVHGRHLYIDDLVTSRQHRSRGYGAVLLKRAEVLARENGCLNLRLCTGLDNERGKSFYEKNSWNFKAIVYKKKL